MSTFKNVKQSFNIYDYESLYESLYESFMSSKFVPTSRKVFKGLKDYGRKLVNLELFTQCLVDLGF